LISAGALSQTPLGELTALPRPHSWNKRDLLLNKGKGCREGKGGERWEAGKRREGRGEDPRVYL